MTPLIKNRFWNILASGLDADHDLESLRKIVLVNILTLLGIVFLVPFAILAFAQGNRPLALVDGVVVVILAGLFAQLRRTREHRTASAVGVTIAGFLFFYLIATGGTNNSAFVWAFSYPLVSLFLLGLRWGSMTSVLLLVAACVVFFFGRRVTFFTIYPLDLILRFIPAYITVYLFALAMEWVRKAVQARLSSANKDLERLVRQLQRTVEEVTLLRGILPICVSCKKIRNDKGYWEQVERYIQERSKATFSHGICPECVTKLYPELNDEE